MRDKLTHLANIPILDLISYCTSSQENYTTICNSPELWRERFKAEGLPAPPNTPQSLREWVSLYWNALFDAKGIPSPRLGSSLKSWEEALKAEEYTDRMYGRLQKNPGSNIVLDMWKLSLITNPQILNVGPIRLGKKIVETAKIAKERALLKTELSSLISLRLLGEITPREREEEKRLHSVLARMKRVSRVELVISSGLYSFSYLRSPDPQVPPVVVEDTLSDDDLWLLLYNLYYYGVLRN